jgi:CHAT domain-containing protein/tetratricopeptide (TPR) repeat protein
MLYRSIRVLAVCTAFVLVCHNAIAQQDEGKTLLAEGDRLAWLKNWQAAEPFFEKAEAVFQKRGDHRNELYAQISRIRGELPRRGLLETSTFLDSLLDDPLLKTDAQLRLRCLIVKGDVDLDFDTDLAARDWTEALSIAKSLGEPAWVNRANGELGVVSFLHGDYRTGTLQVMGALSQTQKLGDLGGQIRYLTLIGDGLIQLGRYDQAISTFDQAMAIGRGNADLSQPVMPYAGKAQALSALGKNTEARELLENLLNISQGRSAFGYESQTLLELGKLEERLGHGPAAIERLKQAVADAKKVDGYNLVSEVDLELSKALLKEKQFNAAGVAAQEGLDASRRIGDKILVPRSLAQLAAVEESKGRYRTADALFREATEIVEAMLATTTSPNAKSSLASSMDSVFLGHFELAATHLGNSREAFAIIEGVRGRSIADTLRFRSVNPVPEPASLTQAEKEISKLQLRILKAGAVERRRLLSELPNLERRVGLIEAEEDVPWLRRQTQPIPITRLQKALGMDEAIVEYVLADPISYCLAISREHVGVFRLPGRTQIGKQVEQLVATLRKNGATGELEAALYASVIAPVESVVSAKPRLIVIPDGPLYSLPFEMIGPRAGPRLLTSNVVTYAPSGTVLTLLSEKNGPAASVPLLAIATGSDPLAAAGANASDKPQFSKVNREVFDFGQPQLPPLPAANSEARAIAGIFGGKSVTLLGESATESALKKQPLGQFRVLHFAVHGLVSSKFPDRSALVLYPDPAGNEDGYWQAREIARTQLNADLVTLSACDVGSGAVVGEEGVSNLVRPFLIAGARTVVANIWEANDDFSRGLMREFYSRLAAGVDKGRALQQAKLEMIRKYGEDASPPRLWAGFIMVGESRRKLPSD